ncbi:MAG: fatty acid desaturase [Proteobacteria bacterium]|nr:fatty acid desaturase [Pseudomonadota bacterium]
MLYTPTGSAATGSAGTPASASARDGADVFKSLPFFAVHAAALLVFFVDFRWSYPVVALALYVVRIFGITAGFHRYFSHRAYKTGRIFQFVLAWLGSMSAQKGVLWWAAHHRDHHKHSDEPEDIHSPRQRGLWWAHVGWILSKRYDETKFERIRDFARFPELRWLNRWHLVPPVTLAVALFVVGGLPLLVWGFFLSTVLTWHGTFTINSLSHVFGSRRYPTKDDSRNNFLLALLTLGEGWHNNHHHYMSTANQGWFWWEVDLTYYVLKLLSWVGLVRDLRTPPRQVRDGNRSGAADTPRRPSSAGPLGVPSLPR